MESTIKECREEPAKPLADLPLWSRDFSLVIIGQVFSIFGNMVLSFALALYILDISESAAMFGLVSGLPYISLIIMTPIGGIMADRLKKQRIMFWLDVATTAIIVLYMAVSGLFEAAVPIVLVKLLALNAIQGMYIPAVQAGVPLLVSSDKLTSGNAAVGVVNTFSSMAGLSVAGILYGRFGLFPILIASAICFAVTAIMDLFIRIPYKKQAASGTIAQIIKADMHESIRFAVKEKPILAKTAVIAFLIVMFLTAILLVGFPVLITQHLGLNMELVGINQSIIMLGGLFGGITAGIMGSKLTMSKSFTFVAISSIYIISIGLVVLLDVPSIPAYIIMTAAGTLVMIKVQLFNTAAITFVQKETPSELVGKVLSMLMILPFLANAFGMLIFGALLEQFASITWIIIFVNAFFIAA
ncbi:MAG: MFS transporter, partial [Treponema sp.]|nr:MFS transporter [Treponema sp.]